MIAVPGIAAALLIAGCVCARVAYRAARRREPAGRLSVTGDPDGGGDGSVVASPEGSLLGAVRARVAEGWAWPALGALVGAVLGGSGGVLIGAAAGAGSTVLTRRRRRRETAVLIDEQMADAVRSLAAAVRSGRSIPQAIAHATAEAEPPLAPTLSAAVDALDLGLPLERVLADWAEVIGSEDARLVSAVVNLHRRSGGDLPAILEQVATTLRDRRAAAREIDALTAQARMSGVVLGLLPVGFFAFLWITSRDDVQGAFASRVGATAIMIGLLLDLAAFRWIRRILAVR